MLIAVGVDLGFGQAGKPANPLLVPKSLALQASENDVAAALALHRPVPANIAKISRRLKQFSELL